MYTSSVITAESLLTRGHGFQTLSTYSVATECKTLVPNAQQFGSSQMASNSIFIPNIDKVRQSIDYAKFET